MSNIETLGLRQLSEIFAALSNSYRLEIFMRLSCCAEAMKESDSTGQICECVGSLGKDLGIAPSTVSHHLKELSRAGLIRMNRRGQTIECQVDPETVKMVADFFNAKSILMSKGD
jgi:ArsR family transcriptional regulator